MPSMANSTLQKYLAFSYRRNQKSLNTYVRNILYLIVASVFVPLTLLVTYTTALVSSLCLAIGSAVNYPMLYLLGQCRGFKKTGRKT